MINAIINFFTDNNYKWGLSNFMLHFLCYRNKLESSTEIQDSATKREIYEKCKMAKINNNDQIAFILLTKCPGIDKWEVIYINSKYSFLHRNFIMVKLKGISSSESYYIKVF